MFLYKNFNVQVYYPTLGTSGLNRIIYPFNDAMNQNYRLPHYILVVPDKDMLAKLKDKNFSSSHTMGNSLYYIMQEFEKLIQRRRQDISTKRPGALPPEHLPYIIWVRMLKRPFIEGELASHIFSNRGKFNSVLENQMMNCKSSMHRIMSIDVRLDEFDRLGNLTTIGKNNFWREVDQAINKFHTGSIKLLPRKFSTSNASSKQEEKDEAIKPRLPSKDFLRRIADQYHKHRRHSNARKRLWSPRHHRKSSSRSPRRHRPQSSHRHTDRSEP